MTMSTATAKMMDLLSDEGSARIRRKLSEEDLLRMRLPERFWRASFDRVLPEESGHRQAVGKYVEKLHAMMGSGYGLYLWGENGAGKTALAAIVLKEAARWGYSTMFIRASQVTRALINGDRFDDTNTLFQRAARVDLLVIDDLGKEYRSDKGYAARVFEDLIRERVFAMRSTIVTANMKPEKLSSLYKESMIKVLSGSVIDVNVSGHDYRAAEGDALRSFLTS